eukprot:15433812-Alexandrium_andersonii.AAC.1
MKRELAESKRREAEARMAVASKACEKKWYAVASDVGVATVTLGATTLPPHTVAASRVEHPEE